MYYLDKEELEALVKAQMQTAWDGFVLRTNKEAVK